ncbi:MAG TPA: hypothetical protein VN872_14200, partial [Candidatus Acidoferrum sp.]|nr:hypothetical protein [Candidatus Acidoferrum sp.]
MFWLRWLVTADSSNDPQAAISSHSVLSPGLGAASEISDALAAVSAWDIDVVVALTAGDECCATSRGSGVFLLLAMMTPETTTNKRNPNAHATVCVRSLKFGSTNS